MPIGLELLLGALGNGSPAFCPPALHRFGDPLATLRSKVPLTSRLGGFLIDASLGAAPLRCNRAARSNSSERCACLLKAGDLRVNLRKNATYIHTFVLCPLR